MIELRDVSYRYSDGTEALRDVSLRVERGRTLLVAGSNGSGKSTMARLMNGLLKPTEGEVLVNGTSTREDNLHSRLKVGLVFQEAEDQLVAETVERDAAFGPENLGLDRAEVEERVDESLKTTGLLELRDRSPHLLSGGQRKRLALAGVLAMRPECVVLDEPLNGLDAPSRRSLLAEVERLESLGYTVVVISQDLEEVWRLADDMVVMQGGEVAASGDPVDLILNGVEKFGVRDPVMAPVLRALREQGWSRNELRELDMETLGRWVREKRVQV